LIGGMDDGSNKEIKEKDSALIIPTGPHRSGD
jgi:hypothetical protein